MLVTGLDATAIQEVEKGVHDGGLQLQGAIKFVLSKVEKVDDKGKSTTGVLACLGGAWDPALDGGNPS